MIIDNDNAKRLKRLAKKKPQGYSSCAIVRWTSDGDYDRVSYTLILPNGGIGEVISEPSGSHERAIDAVADWVWIPDSWIAAAAAAKAAAAEEEKREGDKIAAIYSLAKETGIPQLLSSEEKEMYSRRDGTHWCQVDTYVQPDGSKKETQRPLPDDNVMWQEE